MVQRLGLTNDDLESVALPVGTEVLTVVDRTIDGKNRSQGAVGRVTRIDNNSNYHIGFVDGKSAAYLRNELMPRKAGLVRYAIRRANDWGDLHRCVVMDSVVGSTAWGLRDANSDEDHRGIFVLPMPWLTGLTEPPQDLLSPDGTSAHWELGKAIRQALRADPNTLEMLFSSPTSLDEMAVPLLKIAIAFVSQEIYGSFGRYALAQLDRLVHNQRLALHRETALLWLRDDPQLTLNAAAERLVDAAQVAAPTRTDAVQRSRDYLKQLYRSMYDQGLLSSNEWTALAAYAASGDAAFELPRDLRPKNAYNLIRLLDEGTRWLRGEPATVRVPDNMRATLLSIKRGELPMDDVVMMARSMTPALEAARENSPLPRWPDVTAAEAALREIRHIAADRWVKQDPGPWGANAAPPPIATYTD
jgi:RNA repair pathway DNA polymerase beta family